MSAALAIIPEVCTSALGLDSTSTRLESFSKFDRWQLCSPLTYRPYIYSIERSKPFKEVYQKSRG